MFSAPRPRSTAARTGRCSLLSAEVFSQPSSFPPPLFREMISQRAGGRLPRRHLRPTPPLPSSSLFAPKGAPPPRPFSSVPTPVRSWDRSDFPPADAPLFFLLLEIVPLPAGIRFTPTIKHTGSTRNLFFFFQILSLPLCSETERVGF